MPENARLHIFVMGNVQGVGFRYFIKSKADFLSLTGWVRNLHDDRVEIMVEGEKEVLRGFIDVAGRGPSQAKVTDIDLEWLDYSGKFTRFMVAPSE